MPSALSAEISWWKRANEEKASLRAMSALETIAAVVIVDPSHLLIATTSARPRARSPAMWASWSEMSLRGVEHQHDVALLYRLQGLDDGELLHRLEDLAAAAQAGGVDQV